MPQILRRDLQGILVVAIYEFECLPTVMANSLFSHEKNPEEDKYLLGKFNTIPKASGEV